MNTKLILVLEAVDKASSVINSTLGGVTKKLDTFSKQSAAFGRNSLMGAAAIGAPLGLAVNSAIEFEDKLGNIATIIDTNKESLSDMGNEVINMSKRMPVALDDLTMSLYDIRSAGIDAGQAFGALEASSKLSVAGLSTVGEATDIMTSAMNAFKNEGMSAQKIADILFKTTAYGKTTIAQLSQAFGANAPIVNAAGVKLADFSAATAALTTGGVPASQAQNQLRSAVVAMLKPSADMEKIFAKLGVTTGEELFKKFGSLGNAFTAVKGTAADMDINLAKATGSVEALGAILSITGATNDVYTKSLADMATGSDALDGAFDKQANKGKARMQTLKNNVQALAISVGNILLPAVNDLVGAIGKAATWISDFSERYPVLTKVIVIGTAALAGFLAVMGVVGMAASAVASGLSAMSTVMAFLTGRVKLATIAQWLYSKAQWVGITVSKLWTLAQMAGGGALGFVKSGLASGVSGFMKFISTMRSATIVQWALNAAMTANPIGLIIAGVAAAIAVVTALVVKWHDLVAWFKQTPMWLKILMAPLIMLAGPILAIAGAIRFVIDNWRDLPGAISRGVNSILGYFKRLWDTVKKTFNGIVDFVKSIPSKMFEAGKNIVNSIVDGMKSVAMAPINAISSVVDTVREYLPFSPAKRGALRDIHRIKLVETIAATIKPAPMVKAMGAATMATVMAMPAAVNAKAPGARAAINAVRPAGGAASGGGGITLNFNPTINVGGGNAADMVSELKKYAPELLRMMKAEMEKQQRRGY